MWHSCPTTPNHTQTHIPLLPRLGTAPTSTMSLSNSRFYEEKYPEIDSFVMVNVKQVGLCRCRVPLLLLLSSLQC